MPSQHQRDHDGRMPHNAPPVLQWSPSTADAGSVFDRIEARRIRGLNIMVGFLGPPSAALVIYFLSACCCRFVPDQEKEERGAAAGEVQYTDGTSTRRGGGGGGGNASEMQSLLTAPKATDA